MTDTKTYPTLAERVKYWSDHLPSDVLLASDAAIYVWGRDGWDTPQWPYVKLFAWQDGGQIVVASDYEGDATIERFTDAMAASAWLDRHAHDGWSLGYGIPTDFDPENPDDMHRGPYVPALMP